MEIPVKLSSTFEELCSWRSNLTDKSLLNQFYNSICKVACHNVIVSQQNNPTTYHVHSLYSNEEKNLKCLVFCDQSKAQTCTAKKAYNYSAPPLPLLLLRAFTSLFFSR